MEALRGDCQDAMGRIQALREGLVVKGLRGGYGFWVRPGSLLWRSGKFHQPEAAGLTPEQNIIIELCQHIEALADFLHTSKIAYRKDSVQICNALARAQDCHNRALGLGAHSGRGVV